MNLNQLKTKIREIADFPKPGISYKDITPLLYDADSMRFAVTELVKPFINSQISAVAGMEARGFIFGSLVAQELGVGFIPLRKAGKLPFEVHTISYDLEYGSASLEAHIDAIKPGDTILLVDDLLATGGTAKASCQLVEKCGGKVIACAFVIELAMLKGREKLTNTPIHSLIHY